MHGDANFLVSPPQGVPKPAHMVATLEATSWLGPHKLRVGRYQRVCSIHSNAVTGLGSRAPVFHHTPSVFHPSIRRRIPSPMALRVRAQKVRES